jgi:TnpA family transposase
MRQMQVLPDYEAKQFDLAPKLNKSEREHFFTLDTVMATKVNKARGDINKIGLILQYGYFRASGKFYLSNQFHAGDIRYVARHLKIDVVKLFHKQYVEKSRRNHKKIILHALGYKSFKRNAKLFKNFISGLINKQLSPRKIIFSVTDLLNEKKIEVPGYNTFAKEITQQYNRFENNLIDHLGTIITDEDRKVLDGLLEKDEYYQRPLLIGLKTIRQSTQPAHIKKSLHGFLIIKKLYTELSPRIDQLDMSSAAIRYYGHWVIKAKMTQITDISDEHRRYLMLIAFITHQYKVWQETLLDILMKVTKHYQNKAELMVNAIHSGNVPEKNKLTQSVLQGYDKNRVSVKAVRSILYNEIYTTEQKIVALYKVVPEEASLIDTQADEAADQLSQQIKQDNDNRHFYTVLGKLAFKLQRRVADIIKYLDFSVHEILPNLADAIKHYQTHDTLTKKSPAKFLDPIEHHLVFEERSSFDVSLYKAILFVRVANAVKSGAISLEQSYKYMSIDSYLMDKDKWLAERETILETLGLSGYKDIRALLAELQNKLDPLFYQVNESINNCQNPYVKLKKDGGFSVYTPAIDKPDYDTTLDLLGRDRYVSILQMMAEINADTQFTSCFQHFKHKGGKAAPSDAVFFAGLFGLATNIGLHKLSNSALGINYNTLTNAVEWRFSLENLYAVNDILIERMNKMWLPSQFKKELSLLHTSSDTQKRSVTAESLNTNWSYKYFGNGKGANINMFIDERGILFYGNVFSSAERDAAYVLDGLLHNRHFESDMHSTDTHGYSEIVFAMSHLLGNSFAPRIKDIDSIALVSFSTTIKELEEKGYGIKPTYYANTDSIENGWDDILRLAATIKLREHKLSTIIKRLSSYAKQHPLLNSIKAFGRIVKSLFILNYINDVELRQKIEKQLNKGEFANRFASALTFINNQEIVQSLQEDQEIAAMCRLILQNIIILWNYTELTKLIMRSDKERQQEILANLIQGSIMAWGHVNLLGLYDFRDLTSANDSEFSANDVMEFRVA